MNLIPETAFFLPFIGAFVAGLLRGISPRLSGLARFSVLAGLVGSLLLVVQLPGTLGFHSPALRLLGGLAVLFAILYFVQAVGEEESGEVERSMLVGFMTTGLLLMAFGKDWILALVGMEISSLPMAWFLFRERRNLKASLYLLLAAAVGLLLAAAGVALWVYSTGSLDIDTARHTHRVATLVSAWLLMAGIAYKAGWLPFAAWIPAAYSSGENRFIAFLATAPKLAAAILLYRLAVSLGPLAWTAAAPFVVISILVGVFGALAQKDLRVLLGYSGISHMGYGLMALALPQAVGLPLFSAYMAAYAITAWGGFILLSPDSSGRVPLESLQGAVRRDPFWTMAFMLLLLSMAGVPFVLGFWTKFLIFLRPALAGAWGVVAVALFASVVGLYLYLRVAKWIFLTDPSAGSDALPLPVAKGAYRLLGMVVALFVAVTGLFPAWFFHIFGG